MADRFLSHLLTLPDERPHVHGFHSYPARFAPALVAGLLKDLPAGQTVLDPFAGSGTTLVEARVYGHHAWGNDLNPVAVLLCRVKADPLTPKILGALDNDLQYLRKYIHTRLATKDESEHVKLPPGERFFQAHVYWELQTILGGIDRIRHPHNREIFLAALSAIVNRVSTRARESQPDKRKQMQMGSKRTANLFFDAAERLLDGLREFSRMAKGGSLKVWQGDARKLTGVPEHAANLIITSPPYGGTYDYAEMHALRNVWLGLDWEGFDKFEIGSRRQTKTVDSFRHDVQKVFEAMRRVAAPEAVLYWVIADGMIGTAAYRADELSKKVAEKTGWKFVATGEEERPLWSEAEQQAFGDKVKREYLMKFASV